MFLDTTTQPKKADKKAVPCHYCKKFYSGVDPCDCYTNCEDCHLIYRKVNPCNSHICKPKNYAQLPK